MIRIYKNNDLDQVVKLWYDATKKAHPTVDEKTLQEQKQDVIKDYLPHAKTWVFEEDNNILAFISIYKQQVRALFVHPDQQRRGIGTVLVNHIKENYEGRLSIQALKENASMMLFYESCGFLPTKESLCPQFGNVLVDFVL